MLHKNDSLKLVNSPICLPHVLKNYFMNFHETLYKRAVMLYTVSQQQNSIEEEYT